MVRVLNKNPKQRLGAQGDVEEILGHPWFKGMDREKMLEKKVICLQLRFPLLSSPKSRVTNGCKASIKNSLLRLPAMMSVRDTKRANSTKRYSKSSENLIEMKLISVVANL